MGAHIDDVVNGQTGLDRDFRFGWIEVEIAVETEIAGDGDAQFWIIGREAFKSRRIHVKLRVVLRRTSASSRAEVGAWWSMCPPIGTPAYRWNETVRPAGNHADPDTLLDQR